MKSPIDLLQTQKILRKYWFSLSLIAIVFIAVASKNLSVGFQMKAPDKEKEEIKTVKPLLHDIPESKKKRRTKITSEELIATESTTKSGILSMFSSDADVPVIVENPVLASDETVKGFIRRFAKVGVAEMEKYNIPASITLAQSLLASQSGTSLIANESNNYFNLECGDKWTDKTNEYDGTCLRNYESAWRSFRDHSLYLTSEQFNHLTNLERTDYARWAKGLELAGYSVDKLYAEKLEFIIEEYDLDAFDDLEAKAIAKL